MSFSQSVSTVLAKYAVFSGRARRAEFWWFYLFTVIVGVLTTVADGLLFGWELTDPTPVNLVVSLALLVPSFAVSARRLHDIDRSGWWVLLSLVPLVGIIILVVWWASDSDDDNRYGPSPKYSLS